LGLIALLRKRGDRINPLTDRERWLLEVIGQEFGARDEQIKTLKREGVRLSHVSNSALADKIEG
jgi:hypothetical protein